MTSSDLLGWTAAVLTLLTFASRDMRAARLIALCANACFIAYAATSGLLHVLALHAALVPINLHRLAELRRSRDRRDLGAGDEMCAPPGLPRTRHASTDGAVQPSRNATIQDSVRKNARISCASAAGCSSAAKCPPFGITVQRRMSKTRSAEARGGRRISRGNSQ